MDAQWYLGDLTGWDDWLSGDDPPSWLRDEVARWIASLTERPWRAPSVPVVLDEVDYEWERRTAFVGEFGVGVDYLVNNLRNQIDIRYVGP
jgi:hypothetical protein